MLKLFAQSPKNLQLCALLVFKLVGIPNIEKNVHPVTKQADDQICTALKPQSFKFRNKCEMLEACKVFTAITFSLRALMLTGVSFHVTKPKTFAKSTSLLSGKPWMKICMTQWAEKEEVVCTKGCNHKREKVLQVKFPLVASPPCWLIG